MISQIWFLIWFEKMMKEKLTKEEVDELVTELNELSEFEEQNLERMKEIAHILVQHYMPKKSLDNKNEKGIKD